MFAATTVFAIRINNDKTDQFGCHLTQIRNAKRTNTLGLSSINSLDVAFYHWSTSRSVWRRSQIFSILCKRSNVWLVQENLPMRRKRQFQLARDVTQSGNRVFSFQIARLKFSEDYSSWQVQTGKRLLWLGQHVNLEVSYAGPVKIFEVDADECKHYSSKCKTRGWIADQWNYVSSVKKDRFCTSQYIHFWPIQTFA